MKTITKTESPEYIQLSLAAAMTLGLRPGIFYRGAKLSCINLLLTYGKGCAGSCAYCGLQRQRSGRFNRRSFIRVEWPTFPLAEIAARMKKREARVERVCISMVTGGGAVEDTLAVIRALKPLGKPVSVLMAPTILDQKQVMELKKAGAGIGSVAIDAATPELFRRMRGEGVGGPHRWNRYWQCLGEAVEVFGPGNAGCHLIAGLGETEKEMVQTMQQVVDMGANAHLFSFYPEEGSVLEKQSPCPAGRFRRLQLASYLIRNGFSTYGRFSFGGGGRIAGFGIGIAEADIIIESGVPFMTSGCPGQDGMAACTRPYGDGPPGDIRSYPFMPNLEDIAKIKMEMGDK